MTTAVTQFCLQHHIRLSPREALDFRPLPAGSYSHKFLPYGSTRSGITNGIVAYLAFQSGVLYAQLDNLHVKLDPRGKVSMRAARPREVMPDKPKKLTKKEQLYMDLL